MRPQLYVLAGGNGAGKSTFYARFLEPKGLRFVNADEIAKLPSPEDAAGGSYAAAAVAAEIRSGMLRRRESFCFETVFSHHSKIDFLAEARASGYEIILLIIHLDCPDLTSRAWHNGWSMAATTCRKRRSGRGSRGPFKT